MAWVPDSTLRGPNEDDPKADWAQWIKREGVIGVMADHCLIQFASNGNIKTREQAEKFMTAVMDGLAKAGL